MNEYGGEQPEQSGQPEQPWRYEDAWATEQPAAQPVAPPAQPVAQPEHPWQLWQTPPAEQAPTQFGPAQFGPAPQVSGRTRRFAQARQIARAQTTRQWPTPVIALVAAAVGMVSTLTFHAAVANANDGDQTTPTSITAPQFNNSGGSQQDNSGLTFPRFRFGQGATGTDDGSGSGQYDPLQGLQQGLQGLGLGNGGFGRRGGTGGAAAGTSAGRTTTNTAATAISPAIVDINVTLPDGEGAGTGIVLSRDGEILTNNHVIAGATSITATDVGNGKTYQAVVVGYDKANDVAVLQLQNASGLATATIASSAAKVGDKVVGVGNAEGLGGTPSWAAGSITALNRSITATAEDGSSPETVSGLLQSNTPIQPGDSGGPLVNAAGEVVGMDTAGEFSSLTSVASSAYAVPIAKAQAIAAQIMRGDSANGVHIGATPIIGVMIRSDRVATDNGVQIDDVTANGPAAKAGLAGGDTITAVDGTKVTTPTALTNAILTHKVGDTVSVSYLDANGAKHTANVVLGSGPAQ
ncbi:MAG TPA: S1C family serine protease [Sporichthyaceae bacterium]